VIEYCHKEDHTLQWKHLPVTVKLSAITFDILVFGINGTVYYSKTKEFKEEFNKARAWELLAR